MQLYCSKRSSEAFNLQVSTCVWQANFHQSKACLRFIFLSLSHLCPLLMDEGLVLPDKRLFTRCSANDQRYQRWECFIQNHFQSWFNMRVFRWSLMLIIDRSFNFALERLLKRVNFHFLFFFSLLASSFAFSFSFAFSSIKLLIRYCNSWWWEREKENRLYRCVSPSCIFSKWSSITTRSHFYMPPRRAT